MIRARVACKPQIASRGHLQGGSQPVLVTRDTQNQTTHVEVFRQPMFVGTSSRLFTWRNPYVRLLICCSPLLLALSHGEFFWTDTIELGDKVLVFDSCARLAHAIAVGVQGQYYRPTVFVLNSINSWLLGDHPLTYRTCNLLVHVSNVVLVFSLLGRWAASRRLAFVVAALFAVHPLAVSCINWVADRTDLASFFFALLSLHAALTYVRTGRAVSWICALITFGLAVGAKETAAAMVIVICAAGFSSGAKTRARTFAYLGGQLLLVAGWLAWHTRVHSNDWVRPNPLEIGSRLALGIQVHLEYAAQLLLPHTLTVCDARRVPSLGEPIVVVGFLLLIGVVALVFRQRHQWDRVQAWSLLWVVTFILPTSGVIQLAHVRADRYLYYLLPSAILLVARTAQVALKSDVFSRYRAVTRVATSCVYAYFACLVPVRARHFVNEQALWSYELSQNAWCLEGHSYLARKAYMTGNLGLAETELNLALRDHAGYVAYVDRWSALFYSARLLLDRGELIKGTNLLDDLMNHAPSPALRGEAAYALAISELVAGDFSMMDHHLTVADGFDLPPASMRDVVLLRSYARLKLKRFEDCANDFRRYSTLLHEQPTGFRQRMMEEVAQALAARAVAQIGAHVSAQARVTPAAH